MLQCECVTNRPKQRAGQFNTPVLVRAPNDHISRCLLLDDDTLLVYCSHMLQIYRLAASVNLRHVFRRPHRPIVFSHALRRLMRLARVASLCYCIVHSSSNQPTLPVGQFAARELIHALANHIGCCFASCDETGWGSVRVSTHQVTHTRMHPYTHALMHPRTYIRPTVTTRSKLENPTHFFLSNLKHLSHENVQCIFSEDQCALLIKLVDI